MKSHYELGQTVLIINLSFHVMWLVFHELMVCSNQIWQWLGIYEVSGKFSKAGGQVEVRRLPCCRIQNMEPTRVSVVEGNTEMQVLMGSAAHRAISL